MRRTGDVKEVVVVHLALEADGVETHGKRVRDLYVVNFEHDIEQQRKSGFKRSPCDAM